MSTRFNVAIFGVLGYELDFGELTPQERRQIARQIKFYKKHRHLLQFGRFSRYFPKRRQRESWQMSGQKTVIAGLYNLRYEAAPPADRLKLLTAKPGKRYRLQSVKQELRIGQFGGLIKHVAPIKLRADGCVMRFVDRHFAMTDGQEEYTCSGEALRAGIPLAMQYSGTGYNPDLRILRDWGSSLYVAEEMD